MMERQGEREPEVHVQDQDGTQKWMNREKLGLRQGRILIKGRGQPHVLHRQGYIRRLSNPAMNDTASDNMIVFEHRILTHSGRHVHQGGLAILVVEGKGYTVVDGKRYDWEEGDVILLPLKPGGVEHQHFNNDAARPARWVALQCRPLREIYGRPSEQVEDHPDWKGHDSG